MFGLFM
jgi:hypothetical protein